ncbi:hypothetical protein E4H04_01965 [Candidatus Bathyarchaeota archaeon]|nr:MAG: hypothetical protein E4H04_01965 [Candidatus Bathyarchaeota archaeon]
MSDSGVGFGGFLLGLGAGWYLFQYIDFSFDLIGYLLILMGIGMILNGLLNRGRRQHPISGIFGGIIGGLILATFLTQGFGIVTSITNEFTGFPIGGYRASETFTLNSPVTVNAVDLSIDSVNGALDVYSWSGDSVKFEVEVKARGDTTSEAENNLADFTHDLRSQVSEGVQDVSLSFPIPTSEWNKYSVNIAVYVPSDVSADYNLDTTNGAITFTEILGENIILSTTNGAITLTNIEAPVINVETTNGAIRGTVTSQEARFHTTNGGIDVTLSKISGKHSFSTTNGGIDLNLPTGLDVGYKVNLDTGIGSVGVNLSNMGYSVNTARTKIGESSSYSSKAIQIEITANVSIGGININ